MRNLRFIFNLILWFATLNVAFAQKTIIKGTISNHQGQNYIRLYEEDYEKLKSTLLDSIALDTNGNFYKELEINEFIFFTLNIFNKLNLPIIAQTSEIIEIKADLQTKKYEIKGSPESEKYRQHRTYYDSLMNVYIKPLFTEYPKTKIQKDLKLYQEYVKKLKEVQPKFYSVFDIYEDKILGLGPVLYATVMNTWDEKKLLPKVQELEKKRPQSRLTQILRKKLDRLLATTIGSVASEIELPDPNGQSLKLSSFRGKYVLLEFWASWCKPCRAENPFLVSLYEQYHPLGLEIFGVSLDGHKKHWLEAIEKDKLSWHHVSDLKVFQSAYNQTYNITGVPQNFLIDKDGNIIAKNLKGEDLSKKLKEIFSTLK
jgi:peroxiredoxin